MSFKRFMPLLSLLAIVNCQTNTEWCNMQNCKANEHVACNNRGLFSSTCDSPKAIVLTPDQKRLIMSRHNSYRNLIALGSVKNFSPAVRMAQLTWNDQLAWLAELNTKQCTMQHDKCRNTPTFKYAGQNLAIMMTTATYSVEAVINGSLSMWFNEYENANMLDINSYNEKSSSGKVIGHFTSLVTDRTTETGCAMAYFKTLNGRTLFNSYLFACDYASTNIIGRHVYKAGPTAQSCSLGADNTFKGLCTTKEAINPNFV